MTTTEKKNNNNKNSITVRLSYRTAKTKKYIWKKWQKNKIKRNKWMTKIKQKQGGTELQDILFILHLIYPLYCVLYLACFPFGLAIISDLWWPLYDATWCIVVHVNLRFIAFQTLKSFFKDYINQICNWLVQERENQLQIFAAWIC